MGSSVDAQCKCGYEALGLLIGGGMSNFTTFCSFPVFCKNCQQLQLTNLLAKHPDCPHCQSREIVAYDEDELQQAPGNNIVTSWNVSDRLGRILQLTDGEYFCPLCKEFNLRFEEGGMHWD
jgi:hypothetical protein